MQALPAVTWFLTALAAAPQAPEAWQPVGLCGGGAMFSLAGSPLDPNVMMLSCDMSGAYVSHDAGRTWRMIHHRVLQGCTSCSPVFDPKRRGRVYAPHSWSAELRVSDDNGLTWRRYGGRVPWRGRPTLLYVDADLPDRLFVGDAGRLYLTRDDAKTWSVCAGVTGRPLGVAVDRASPADRRAYFVGTTEGVSASTDGGATFRRSGRGLPEGGLLSFAGGSDGRTLRLYATVPCTVVEGKLAGGVYVSTDGEAWRRCMNPQLNVQTKRASEWAHGDVPRYLFIRTTDKQPRRAYVFCTGTSYYPPNHCTVYRTDDGGASWRPTLFSDPRFKQYNADDDWLTKGAGQRWQDVPFTVAINPGEPDVLMMASSMFVFRTDDGGKRWRACHVGPPAGGTGRQTAWRNNGLVVTSTWNYYADPHDAQRHYICYTDIGFARSLDAGRSWIWQGPALPWRNTVYELAFDPDVPGRIWGAFSNTHDIPNGNIILGRHRVHMSGGVAVSADHGQTWTKQKLPEAPVVSIVLDPTSPRERRRLYASLFTLGVYRSDDDGRTWRKTSRGLGHADNMRCCRLHRHADGTLFVLITAKRLADGRFTRDGVGLYRSADRGESWAKVSDSLPLHWPKDFAVHPTDGRTILLAAGSLPGHPEGGLYRTTDGGATWQLVARKGPEHFGAFYHPRRRGWIYATLTEGATESGMYLSKDDGKTWRPFSRLPFANIQRVHFLPGDEEHIVVTTFGGSVFRGPVEPGG